MEKKLNELYQSYRSTSDADLKRYLENVVILGKKPQSNAYHRITDSFMLEIKDKLRKHGFSFSIESNLADPYYFQGPYLRKEIYFLCKSSSRFFLKADIGEVFDAITASERDKVIAIYVDSSDNQCISGTGDEHFIVLATIFLSPE